MGRGLYTVAAPDITENHTLALVAKSVDHGVMCLAYRAAVSRPHHAGSASSLGGHSR